MAKTSEKLRSIAGQSVVLYQYINHHTDRFTAGTIRDGGVQTNGSFIPDKNIRILRELVRYHYKFTSMKSSEKTSFRTLFLFAMWRWIPSCPIYLASPQPLLRTTSHPTGILTPSIAFPRYSILSRIRRRRFPNRLQDMNSQPNRKLALESSGTIFTTLIS